MIVRDTETRNIIITPEDLPAIAGLVLTARDLLMEDKDKISGSFREAFNVFFDAAERFELALKQ